MLNLSDLQNSMIYLCKVRVFLLLHPSAATLSHLAVMVVQIVGPTKWTRAGMGWILVSEKDTLKNCGKIAHIFGVGQLSTSWHDPYTLDSVQQRG